jgi:DNA helicase-2/ATP-dependent DNA helicase PcrA
MLAYLRILVNTNDDQAIKRIINYPARGIGKTTVSKLEELANKNDLSFFQVLESVDEHSSLFNRGTIGRLKSFSDFLKENQKKINAIDAYELALHIATSTGILKELHNGNTPEERSKFENLEELLNGIRDFADSSKEEGLSADLARYLEDIALLTDFDKEDKEDKNTVSIMTMHAAKGLEFNYVYIAGVEEELFPSRMSLDSSRELEEERRLFYVAVTRAKKKVFISYAQSRFKWGVPTDCQPSRFLKDIDENLVEWPEDKPAFDNVLQNNFGKTKSRPQLSSIPTGTSGKRLSRINQQTFNRKQDTQKTDPNFQPSDPLSIQQGMLVEHQRFGKGKIVHIEGEMPNKKATVFFQQIKQEKQLLLKFARLRIVE